MSVVSLVANEVRIRKTLIWGLNLGENSNITFLRFHVELNSGQMVKFATLILSYITAVSERKLYQNIVERIYILISTQKISTNLSFSPQSFEKYNKNKIISHLFLL